MYSKAQEANAPPLYPAQNPSSGPYQPLQPVPGESSGMYAPSQIPKEYPPPYPGPPIGIQGPAPAPVHGAPVVAQPPMVVQPQQMVMQPVTRPPGRPYVQNSTVMVVTNSVGRESCVMTCPHCKNHITTATDMTNSMVAYISGIMIALAGCFWGCCLIPCCIDSCKNVEHSCPSCRRVLGTYKPMGI